MQRQPPQNCGLPLAFGEIGVKERVKSVMNYKKPTFWIILAAIIACIVLAVCFLTDPVASKTEQPSDPAVSNTEATPRSGGHSPGGACPAHRTG